MGTVNENTFFVAFFSFWLVSPEWRKPFCRALVVKGGVHLGSVHLPFTFDLNLPFIQ